ncbi:MAG: antibiotic biosynthesis monooxygenase [Myxococcales bacterium]|nr:antibiotic biosynthesis monooxygenase [Myxococcales bacterium]
MQCTQIVVYRIRPDALDAFHAIKERLIEEAHTLPGLLSSVTLSSAEDPTLFVDQMQWTSAEAVQAAMPVFEALPTTPTFMGLMAGPPELVSTFSHAAGDRLDRATA